MAKPTRRTYTAAEKSALVAEFERQALVDVELECDQAGRI